MHLIVSFLIQPVALLQELLAEDPVGKITHDRNFFYRVSLTGFVYILKILEFWLLRVIVYGENVSIGYSPPRNKQNTSTKPLTTFYGTYM